MTIRRFSFCLLVFAWLIGCKNEDHLPHSLRGVRDAGEQLMVEAIELVQEGPASFTYQSFSHGTPGLAEHQWTGIVSLGSKKYHSVEVYDLYTDAQGREEYFVQAFSLNLQDTLARFEVKDIRFRTTLDTAYYLNLYQPGLRVRRRWPHRGQLSVYEMEGFEYLDSPDYGQLKYWSPEVGTILQYFGQGETFELVDVGDPTLNTEIEQLRADIRQQWVPH